MKRKFGKVNFKIFLFLLSTLITLTWIIVYAFFHEPFQPLILYFTYQSNFILWIYYSLWMVGYLNFRFFSRRKFLRIMDNYRWSIFIGSTISLTSFIVTFFLGPFYPIYYFFHFFKTLSFNSNDIFGYHITFYDYYHAWNVFAMHFLLPWLVIYDLWTETYDEDKINKSAFFNGIIYFAAYLIFVEINGAINHVYPYPVLDKSAFYNENLGLFFAIVSPIIVSITYLFLDYAWYKNLIQKNGGYLFNDTKY